MKQIDNKFYKYESRAENRIVFELKMMGNKAPEVIRQYEIGKYKADFYFPNANLVLEVDGSYHSSEKQIDHDRIRDKFMNEKGFGVLRVSGKIALENTIAVILASSRLKINGRTLFIDPGNDLKDLLLIVSRVVGSCDVVELKSNDKRI